MSILDLYNSSKDFRVVQAKSIPFTPKNYFDPQKIYFSDFEINAKQGDPTEYTPKALDEFDTEYNAKTIPQNFGPNTPFMQWNETNKYSVPGAVGNAE